MTIRSKTRRGLMLRSTKREAQAGAGVAIWLGNEEMQSADEVPA